MSSPTFTTLRAGTFSSNALERNMGNIKSLFISQSNYFTNIEAGALQLPGGVDWNTVSIYNNTNFVNFNENAFGTSNVNFLEVGMLPLLTSVPIRVVSKAITVGISALNALTVLPSPFISTNITTTFKFINMHFTTLPANFFGDTTSIEVVTMASSAMQTIEPEVFSRLSNLHLVCTAGYTLNTGNTCDLSPSASSAVGLEVIVPAVVGGLALMVIALLFFVYVRRRRNSKGILPSIRPRSSTTSSTRSFGLGKPSREPETPIVEMNTYGGIGLVESNLSEYTAPPSEKSAYQEVIVPQYSPRTGPRRFGTLPEPPESRESAAPAAPAAPVKYTYLYFDKPCASSESLRDDIKLVKPLGEGQFGKVYFATVSLSAIPEARRAYFVSVDLDSPEPGNRVAVAVKTLKEAALEKNMNSFIAEAQTIAGFEHTNVVRVCGILTEKTPMMIILEFMPYGDLESLLRKSESLSIRWNPLEFMHCLQDIAKAMEYLQSLRFVHRDLAARNCLVGHDFVIKISDFGLSRRIAQDDDYYKMKQGGLLPVRWLAPESLSFMSFTSASDVWAFGVTAWEIYSYGNIPYGDLPLDELLPKIERGERLGRPQICDRSVWEHIRACWKWNPKDRPSFAQLASTMNELAFELADSNELRDVPALIYGRRSADNYISL